MYEKSNKYDNSKIEQSKNIVSLQVKHGKINGQRT